MQQKCSYDSVTSTQVQHFSDASRGAYGVVTFLRFVCKNDNVICRFIFSKARLAPLKTISISGLELTAAFSETIAKYLIEFLPKKDRLRNNQLLQ